MDAISGKIRSKGSDRRMCTEHLGARGYGASHGVGKSGQNWGRRSWLGPDFTGPWNASYIILYAMRSYARTLGRNALIRSRFWKDSSEISVENGLEKGDPVDWRCFWESRPWAGEGDGCGYSSDSGSRRRGRVVGYCSGIIHVQGLRGWDPG